MGDRSRRRSDYRDSGLLTENGFAFELAPDATLSCGPEDFDVETFLEPDQWEEVAVDVASGDIVEVGCISRE